MAAANFVVITNGGGCALTGTAEYRPIACHVLSFRELRRIGCRLSLKIDRNLEGSLSVAT